MKFEKLSLASVKNVLSRAELRKIMAGSGPGGTSGGGGTGGGGGGGGTSGGQGCYTAPSTGIDGCPAGTSCVSNGYGSSGTCQ